MRGERNTGKMGIFTPAATMKNRTNKLLAPQKRARSFLSIPPSFSPFPFSPYFIISGVWRYLSNTGISLSDRLQTSAGNEIRALIFSWPLKLQDEGAAHLSAPHAAVNYLISEQFALPICHHATGRGVFINLSCGSNAITHNGITVISL